MVGGWAGEMQARRPEGSMTQAVAGFGSVWGRECRAPAGGSEAGIGRGHGDQRSLRDRAIKPVLAGGNPTS